MASVEIVNSLVERTSRLEAEQVDLAKKNAAIEAILPYLAKREDMERQTKLLIMWFIGIWIASVVLLVSILSLIFMNRLPA